MHDRKHDSDKDRQEAVVAADDTGLVAQQELIVETELGLPVDEGHGSKQQRHER